MHCFICVTYMVILTTASPVARDIPIQHEKRSLFRDVIESLRIRSQLPEEINQNDDNNLSQSFDRYGYEEPLHLPSDADFIPRRNDRIEMPPLKYRFPKSLSLNDTNERSNEPPKEEVVVYIHSDGTTQPPKPVKTQKPKTKPQATKSAANKNGTNTGVESSSTENYKPLTNHMGGQSQIGNRESQTVVKPTVIVNIRGTVSHTDSDIRLERRGNNDTLEVPRNVFNINQEINLGREPSKKPNKIKQDVKLVTNSKMEEDMMMCETAAFKKDEVNKGQNRKIDNVLQILFSI